MRIPFTRLFKKTLSEERITMMSRATDMPYGWWWSTRTDEYPHIRIDRFYDHENRARAFFLEREKPNPSVYTSMFMLGYLRVVGVRNRTTDMVDLNIEGTPKAFSAGRHDIMETIDHYEVELDSVILSAIAKTANRNTTHFVDDVSVSPKVDRAWKRHVKVFLVKMVARGVR